MACLEFAFQQMNMVAGQEILHMLNIFMGGLSFCYNCFWGVQHLPPECSPGFGKLRANVPTWWLKTTVGHLNNGDPKWGE